MRNIYSGTRIVRMLPNRNMRSLAGEEMIALEADIDDATNLILNTIAETAQEEAEGQVWLTDVRITPLYSGQIQQLDGFLVQVLAGGKET